MALDKILIVPTGISPHKNYGINTSDRVEMVKLSIKDNDNLELELYEANSNNVCYTIDTLKYLKAKHPEDELFFIIGTDNLIDIENWKDVDQYYIYTKILLADRLTDNIDVSSTIKHLKSEYNLDVYEVDTPIIEISSTEIRTKVDQNKSIKYMCTAKVVDYIENNRLYK